MKKTKSEEVNEKTAEILKAWGIKFPVGTAVAIVGDDESRTIGKVNSEPIQGGLGEEDGVLITVDATGTDAQVPIRNVRPRAIERRKGSQILRVTLTDAERLAIGNTLADAIESVSHLEDDLETFKKQIQGQIKAKESEAASAGSLLRNGYEMRSVAITRTLDFDLGRAVITRNDTGDVIETRAIAPDEQQRELFVPAAKAEDETDADGVVTDQTILRPDFAKDAGATAAGPTVSDSPQGPRVDPPAGQSQARAPLTPKKEVPKEALDAAKAVILETRRATVSTLQRRLKIGYPTAAGIMDALQDEGFVGPANGEEPREILALGKS